MKLRVVNVLVISLYCTSLFLNLNFPVNIFSPRPQLKFRPDGTFKIVQFADIHEGPTTDYKTIDLMNKILDKESPDLVVLTGDNTDGKCSSEEDIRKAIADIAQPMEKRGISWAIVFGNHDDEHEKMSKEEMMKIYMSYPHNISQAGPRNVDGVGNYNLEVKSSKRNFSSFNIYLLDSAKYSGLTRGYDWIKFSQIEWYRKTSSKISEQNGGPVPSLMFFHIPLPQWSQVWKSGHAHGHRNENECTPKIDSGLFVSLLEMGDVKGVFVGHDHENDYTGDFFGIKLGYSRNTGYSTYGREGFAKGARVFLINETNPSQFQTWMRLASDF